jgi:uncharacterized protein YhjY with autotransporter beta-barrel domain
MNGANDISDAPSNGGVLVGGGFANLTPSTAKLMNVTIDAVSPGFAGLLVNRGYSATMTGGSITITGNGNPAAGSGPSPPNGIVAAAGVMTNSQGQATLSGVAIMTHGSNSPAVDVEAQITPDEGMLNPAGGPITISGGSITTLGANSFGVLANAVGGTVTLDGTPITTSGDGAAGFFANAGAITATNTTTQTSGAAAPGGILSNGGTLTINGGSVTTTGPGSFGFLVQPAAAPPLTPSSPGPNMLQISNATVNAAADAFHVTGAVADITVDRSTIVSSNRVLLNSIGSTGTFNIENSTLTGNILADSASTVDVNLLNNSTLTAVIQGAHNLMIDPSTWIMPDDSSITGNLTLLGRLMITSAAKFAATGEASVLTIGGNLMMGSGSTTSLGIGGLNGEQYDHIQVGGNATVNGSLVVSSLGGFHPSAGDAFLVLHTNGTRTGNFSLLNDSAFNNNPNISAQLRPVDVEIVAPNGIVLAYVAPSPSPPPSPGPKPPIIDVVPEPLPPVNPEGPIPPQVILPLLDPTVAQLTSLYQVSFTGAGLQRSSLDDRMFQLQRAYVPPPPPPPTLTGKEAVGKAPPPPPAPSTPCWGVWASGYGNWTHVGTSQGYHFDTAGMSAGVDYLLTPHWAVGLFGGYSHNWINFKSNGSADSDTGLGGLYTTYFDPTGWWVNAAVWGGGTSYSTSRQAVLGPANGDTNGWLISTYGEAGYDLRCGALAYGPFVTMAYTDTQVNGFTEHGSLVPLAIHEDSQDSLITDIGGRLYYDWRLNQMALIPQLKLAWEHEYLYSSLPITASAPTFGGATAVFHGPSIGHDSLVINAGVLWQVNPRIAVTVSYDGQLARDHYYSNGVDGVFSWSF